MSAVTRQEDTLGPHYCANCHVRPATHTMGDMLAMTHGWAQRWCEACVLQTQIAHAEERAAALPGLRDRLQEILDA